MYLRGHLSEIPEYYTLRYPLQNPKLLTQWLHAVKRKGFQPSKSSKICSEHFRESDFQNQPGFKYKRLKENAVPSVFEEFPEHLQKKPKRNRTTKTSCNAVSMSDYVT